MFKRQLTFWIPTLPACVPLPWLLADILLPFVAGLALAYPASPIDQGEEPS